MSHYKILGIPRDASRELIRAAYIQKAKRYHPDINQSPNAETLFKAVQDAYQTLNNDAKREEHDAEHEFSSSGNVSFSDGAKLDTASRSSSHNPYRYRGRTYDPEKERLNFSRNFYEQAEALKREMEEGKSAMAEFRLNFRRIIVRILWKFFPYILFPSLLYWIVKWYRVKTTSAGSPVLHDMYGRAYITDRFGRRNRAPRFDNKKKLERLKEIRKTEINLRTKSTLSNEQKKVDMSATENKEMASTSLPKVSFQSVENVVSTRRRYTDNFIDNSIQTNSFMCNNARLDANN